MKRWISLPRAEGVHSRQAHADLPQGSYEREMGKEGFYGPSCHFHHAHPPTAWSAFEGELRPRAYDLNKLDAGAADPFGAPRVLFNDDLELRLWRCERPMSHLVRNQDGDQLLFVHAGQGDLYCDWGHLEFRDGDYLLLPRGALWRIVPRGSATMLLLEATDGAYGLPDRGMMGAHAIFDPAVLDTPRIDGPFKAQQGEIATQVRVKRRGVISRIDYPFNPLDAVGWHGDLLCLRVNWRDMRPVMSHRYHLPPSVHTTFVAPGFVVCTFCPRPLESDPGALRVPFFHSNDDYDEVIFYHRGRFFSRDHIVPGMLSFHPCGFTHGPHPKAFAAAARAERAETDEVAVMVDARRPLNAASLPAGVEMADYVDSWQAK